MFHQYYFVVKFVLMIMLLFGGATKCYDVILAPLFQMVDHHILKDDLELLESDPSTFIKKYEAKIYEESSIKVQEIESKMKTKDADKMKWFYQLYKKTSLGELDNQLALYLKLYFIDLPL